MDTNPSIRPETGFVARATAMRALARQLERAAELDANALLTGPSGSGKSALARLLHELGPRARGPFVSLSCATSSREQLEAALFGDSGRAARGGTLLLDDVEEFPLELQPRLLKLLQERVLFRSGPVRRLDIRIVATTSADLAQRVREGRFRDDLYFRLRVLTMRVPGLAERKEDLPELAARILSRFGAHVRLSDAAMQRLAEHDWPGNLRELENLLERAAAFSPDGLVDVAHLEFDEARPKAVDRPRLAGYTMEQIERWALLDTLERVGGNKAAAARMLGLCEKTIYNKLKRLRARKRQAD